MSDKITSQRKKNKELALLISNLKGIGGDKPTKVTPPSKRKTSYTPKKKSTGAIMKEVGNIFKKDGPTGSEVQELEDYISGYGNPIGAGPANVSGVEGAGYSTFKKGGRIKKNKVKKRAALRGQRCELRGS